jgi:hypothetical protein
MGSKEEIKKAIEVLDKVGLSDLAGRKQDSCPWGFETS